MISQQHLYAAHNNAVNLFMKISRWEEPEIDIHFISEIRQPARNFPGIDYSGNR